MNGFWKMTLTSVFGLFLIAELGFSQESDIKHLSVNGAELAYVEEGSGTPVVFVPPAILDLRGWDGYRSKISDKRRYIAYSQRYYGTDPWPDGAAHFSRETHIQDLIAFVEGLDSGPVHLITWSYSGEIGVYAALRRPDLFQSLVHYEPSVEALLVGLPGAEAAQRKLFANFGPAIAAVEANRLEDAALRFVEAVFQLPEGGIEQEPGPFLSYWRENGRTIPPMLSMAPGQPISCEELGRLDIPTLIVRGENSYVYDSMIAERLADCQSNALLITMADANHDGPYRKPEQFANFIVNFLDLVER